MKEIDDDGKKEIFSIASNIFSIKMKKNENKMRNGFFSEKKKSCVLEKMSYAKCDFFTCKIRENWTKKNINHLNLTRNVLKIKNSICC